MKKRKDWRPRLRGFLAKHEATPFSYDSALGMDCGAFAGGAVSAMSGHNPHAAVAGQYTTLEGAMKALRALGYDDHIALTADALEEIDPAFATYGDIAVLEGPDGPSLGVVLDAHIEVRGHEGRALRPLTDAVRAFRVPDE